MNRHNFKSVSEIVDQVISKHLPQGDVEALSRQLERINLCWPQCTSEKISQNVKPILLTDEELVLETHSPVWANKMRYLQSSTISRLKEFGFTQVKTIRVTINPAILEKP